MAIGNGISDKQWLSEPTRGGGKIAGRWACEGRERPKLDGWFLLRWTGGLTTPFFGPRPAGRLSGHSTSLAPGTLHCCLKTS